MNISTIAPLYLVYIKQYYSSNNLVRKEISFFFVEEKRKEYPTIPVQLITMSYFLSVSELKMHGPFGTILQKESVCLFWSRLLFIYQNCECTNPLETEKKSSVATWPGPLGCRELVGLVCLDFNLISGYIS